MVTAHILAAMTVPLPMSSELRISSMQSEIHIDAGGPLMALFDRTDAYHAGIIN
ncbi:MAG: hypothetical protein Ta2A_17660 [Treponemataceae bacterium]|nr:MAG: hypothetical protein Ta2A_17660 [Treponemataceae bacterium]